MGTAEAVELFGAEQVARASRYHRPLYRAAVAQLALELVLLGAATLTPLGRWLFEPFADWPWWAQTGGFTLLIEAGLAAAGLPLSYWSGFAHERAWGFSTQRRAGYLADRAKALCVGFVLAVAATVGLVASARLLPRLWPLACAGAGAVFVVGIAFLAPLLVEPLFNRFVPLADSGLSSELLALAERAGIPLSEVLVADASRRTHKSNAYVSGLGHTRRLVLYDTLLERSARPELGLVLAHELGHRRARHLAKGVAFASVALAGFVLVVWALLRSGSVRGAVSAPAGAASAQVVPFVFLLAALLQLLGAPFGAALSRAWERAADRFSLELTHDLATFEATHRSLATANLSDLDPPRSVYVAFFSHPTAVERIDAARRLAGVARPPESADPG